MEFLHRETGSVCFSMSPKFKCNALKGKNCESDELRYCCYYCPYIKECFKDWQRKDRSHYCRLKRKIEWCGKVKRFLEAHGLKSLKNEEFVFR